MTERKNETPIASRSKPCPPQTVTKQLSSAQLTADQQTRVADLAERLYQHVLRVVDLDMLFGLEQCLWSELQQMQVADDDGELANALIAEALHRVGHGPDRHVKMIPEGITPEEVVAAEYDDDCLMCRSEIADIEYRMSGERCQDLARQAEDKDWLALQARARDAWRAEHAEALRRFGLD